MYTKGYFPMAKNDKNSEVEFFKPYKRFLIPISNFHMPKSLFKEFKKKIIFIE
jgi:Leu/Phe-tRNA-protein transferase